MDTVSDSRPAPLDRFWFVPVALLALCLLMFGDVLLGIRHGVLSDGGKDLAGEFYYWRDLGFSEMRHGHIAQWNPYVYGGVPFFAGWQAGLFYPPNWIYLVLPLDKAINCDIVISTFLAGFFTALLARRFGLHPLACLLAGTATMFGGAFFPHIYAGHLATLATMAWVPLVLLGVDAVFDNPTRKSVLLCGFALAMQLLSGHPQTMYNTIVMLALYTVIRLVRAPSRPRIVAALVGAGGVMFLLTAVQVLTGLQVNQEGTRSAAVPYNFATAFSYPPENLLTLLSPNFFGDNRQLTYWGQWYQWEETLYVGVILIPLIALGLTCGLSHRRKLWGTMALAFMLIAVGNNTPLYHVLFYTLPGLSKFRSPSKFIYEASLFLALLAGAGLDVIIRRAAIDVPEARARWNNASALATALAAVLGLVCAVGALIMITPAASAMIQLIIRENIMLDKPIFSNIGEFIRRAQIFSSQNLTVSALLCFASAGLLWASARNRRWGVILVLAASAELFVYAHATVTTFSPSQTRSPLLDAMYKADPGDYRIIQNPIPSNRTMAFRTFDLWGYDPMVLKRYTEFVIGAQGGDVNQATMYSSLTNPAPALRMLRLKYVFNWDGDNAKVSTVDGGLPHGMMIYRCNVITGRDKIFREILKSGYDFEHVAVLEAPPTIALQAPPPGAPAPTVSVTWRDTDTLDVEAQTATPGIILITDTYSRFFEATALPGSAQQTYHPVPANYTLIGIPVRAGRHHFLLTYRPSMYRIGAMISILSIALFGFVGWREWRGNDGRDDTGVA